MKPLDGKAAPTTGAARGIGRAFVEAYVGERTRAASAVRLDRADQQSIEARLSEVIAAQTCNGDGGPWMS